MGEIVHELKCWPSEFQATLDGRKRHEFRRNDRGFSAGDTLHLREWVPGASDYASTGARYTGRETRVRVTYVGTGFGIPDGYVTLSIVRLPEPDEALADPVIGELQERLTEAEAERDREKERADAAEARCQASAAAREALRAGCAERHEPIAHARGRISEGMQAEIREACGGNLGLANAVIENLAWSASGWDKAEEERDQFKRERDASHAQAAAYREALERIAEIAHDPDPEVQAAIAAGEHPPAGAPCPTCDIERIARRTLAGADGGGGGE